MSIRFGERLGELEAELFALVGHPFNLRSTQQLSQVLFDELAFPTKGMKKTASGHYSTAVGTLDQLVALDDELSERAAQRLDDHPRAASVGKAARHLYRRAADPGESQPPAAFIPASTRPVQLPDA